MPPALLLQCRPGFESDCAAEITERAAAAGTAGFCRARPDTGLVAFEPQDGDAAALHRTLAFDTLVFPRQWFVSLAVLSELPAGDRVAPLAAALGAAPGPLTDCFIEHPDTNQGKTLARLRRGLAAPLRQALDAAGRLAPGAPLRGHVLLLDSHTAHAGYAETGNASPWPMGIPRLRRGRRAPSRSGLKLEEALMVFLTPEERERWLAPGMHAVDLGAAPGGWSWQLAARHLRVAAVDNGPLQPALLDTGLVEHLRADGFRYRPARPVDWMVCDMVERPQRVARLAARWITEGWCRRCVANLKLPMRRRHATVQECLDALRDAVPAGCRIRCRQLYHDREEVTVFVAAPGP